MNRRRRTPRPTGLDAPLPPPKPAPEAEPSAPAPPLRLVARAVAALFFPALAFGAAAWLLPYLLSPDATAACARTWPGLRDAAFAPFPGGALRWCADCLAGHWPWPWFDGTAFLALGALSVVLGRLTRLPLWAATLPFAATLCCLAWRGAAGWPPLGGAAPFALLLGWCVCLLVLALARAVGGWAALAAAALYPLAGAPALLAALVALTLPRLSLPSRLLFAAVLFLPLAWRRFVAADAAWEPLLLANAPFLATDAAQALNHANLLCLILVAGAVWWAYLPQGVLRLRLGLWVPPLAFAAAIALSPAAARACPALPAASTHETEALP